MSFPKAITGIFLAAALAACGGHSNNQNQTQSSQNGAGIMTGSPAPPVNNTTPIGAATAGNGGSMAGIGAGGNPAAAPVPVPASLNCGSAQPVWVNKRSHAYHEPSDPLYGRTKHGSYMCPDAALSAGYHLAAKGNGHHHRYSNSMSAPSTEPSPVPT